MAFPEPRSVVHLELHTGDVGRATAFYAELLNWRPELVRASHLAYLALAMGGVGGGAVECRTERPGWLPYAEVTDLTSVTAKALDLGATLLLPPREGPAGWRSVIEAPAGGEIALWQQKRSDR